MAGPSTGKLTLREAADRFGVSIHTLRDWRDKGLLSKLRRGRIVVVDAEEVRRQVERIREVRPEGQQ